MLKIVTIIGARPQIIKAAALSRAIREFYSDTIHEVILHTGQHYDRNMSDIFIEELGIPQPDYNLGIGSASHGQQTADMIKGIEDILIKEQPDWCVLFGDTNSTLAGAVAASKIHIPVAHIEAGLRSYDKTMPEELNRIGCDHCSTLLFAPTQTAIENLIREGFDTHAKPPYHINHPGIIHSGDVMFDNTLFFKEIALSKTDIFHKLNLPQQGYALCTIHRPHNTDNKERLASILSAIIDISHETGLMVVVPLHPRTVKYLNAADAELVNRLKSYNSIKLTDPVSFLEMTALEAHADIILTDSGGVQKEAYFFNKPCVILRNETEWVEIVEKKAGILADADYALIKQAVHDFRSNPPIEFPALFGDGQAAKNICNYLADDSILH
jgi:UDP-GlcNAc3NAcA epimerase